MEVKVTHIGDITRYDGIDVYYLFRCLDAICFIDDIEKLAMEKFYAYGSERIGSWFCHDVSVMCKSFDTGEWIVIAHRKQNV